ncbi:MAG: helix-turn-helix domain-containing protein [Acidimicrobiaceae bacterium]|nr:helix-turn-helix domain-containing protein [Acidimicrobiaceae bacterium]
MTSLAESPSGPGILTPALAQEIAGETSAIIGLNILITDADGMVMGSGDQSRVGTFHEASLEVVRTQTPAAHNAKQARELTGVRPGMTLPIVHDGTAVGTVGITGTPSQARRFGLVVKRQTEILLEEAVLLRSRMTRERVLESLLRDLLTYDVDNPADLTTRARDFGFDLSLGRQAIVLETPSVGVSGALSPLRLIREAFHDPQDISCTLSATRHVVLRSQFHGRPELTRDDLVRLSQRIDHLVGPATRVGVGGVARDERDIATSYEEALTAMRIGAATGRSSPYEIDDLRTEQLVVAMPYALRSRITDETLRDLRRGRDWSSTRATVIAWVESGFVLVDAAAALNIHRNTLVYRLERLAELTGWPTSDRRHWLALYLTCLADRLDGP